MQFFTKNTYPLLLLQADVPHVKLSISLDELNISGGSISRDLINAALNEYMCVGSSECDDVVYMYQSEGIVVFMVRASACRLIDMSNPDISIMYIVSLLLKYKVVFVTNIPQNRYHQTLDDVSQCWSSKFLGASPDA